jgi:hypothetical protein
MVSSISTPMVAVIAVSDVVSLICGSGVVGYLGGVQGFGFRGSVSEMIGFENMVEG